MKKRSWKTTLGGIMASVGVLLTAAPEPGIHIAGIVMAAIGTALTGVAARDNGVTSEEAGAKPSSIVGRL